MKLPIFLAVMAFVSGADSVFLLAWTDLSPALGAVGVACALFFAWLCGGCPAPTQPPPSQQLGRQREASRPRSCPSLQGRVARGDRHNECRSLILAPVNKPPCPECGNHHHVHVNEHAPLFQDHAEAVKTLGDEEAP